MKNFPDLKRLLWAVHGQGAFVSVGKKAHRKIQVSSETNSCRSTIILSRSNRWAIENHLSSIAQLEKKQYILSFFWLGILFISMRGTRASRGIL